MGPVLLHRIRPSSPVSRRREGDHGPAGRGDAGRSRYGGSARRPRRDPVGDPVPSAPGLPRLSGGAVGFIGYDYVRHLEKVGGDRPLTDTPDAMFLFPHGS